eukprot:8089390-Heterocapsa_arctica.AAC.1
MAEAGGRRYPAEPPLGPGGLEQAGGGGAPRELPLDRRVIHHLQGKELPMAMAMLQDAAPEGICWDFPRGGRAEECRAQVTAAGYW